MYEMHECDMFNDFERNAMFWWFHRFIVILPNCISETYTNHPLFLQGNEYILSIT